MTLAYGRACAAGMAAFSLVLVPAVSAQASTAALTPHQAHAAHCRHVPSACQPVTALAPNPVNAQLQGTQATAWSRSALAALGAPATTANLKTLADWYLNEGAPHNYNNPLNLETPFGGSHSGTEDGDPLSDHIQDYPVPADFASAFAIEMHDSRYPQMLAHLLAGTGLEGAQGAAVRSELDEYSGGGYRTIPAP